MIFDVRIEAQSSRCFSALICIHFRMHRNKSLDKCIVFSNHLATGSAGTASRNTNTWSTYPICSIIMIFKRSRVMKTWRIKLIGGRHDCRKIILSFILYIPACIQIVVLLLGVSIWSIQERDSGNNNIISYCACISFHKLC